MISMRFEGGDQLARNLRELSTRASKQVIRTALKAGAEPMRSRVAASAARAPGAPDLADHIVISTSRARSGDAAAVAVGPSKESRSDQPNRSFDIQGYLLEFGTIHRSATPFMKSAVQAMGAALAIVKGELWDALVRKGFSTRGSGGGGGLL